RESCSGPLASESEDKAQPATPMMASIVAALQVDFGLRELGRSQNTAYTVNLDFEGTPHVGRVRHPRAGSCPFHEPLGSRMPASRQCTAHDLLRNCERNEAVLLDWPICTECTCNVCGHCWRPMRRTAEVRRLGRCPACGSDRVTPSETIEV